MVGCKRDAVNIASPSAWVIRLVVKTVHVAVQKLPNIGDGSGLPWVHHAMNQKEVE